MSNRRKLIAGNWKMNGSGSSVKILSSAIAQGLAEAGQTEVLLCPSFVHISTVVDLLDQHQHIMVGAQDLSINQNGAYTSEISAQMLTDIGCKFVIIGHSERREYHQESDQQVAEKVEVAIKGGLTPILCVGETLAQREAGETETIIEQQVIAVLNRLGVDAFSQIVIAYEPVWAIGTGVTASPEQAQQVQAFIRELIAKQNQTVAAGLQILYGGSMKPDNAAQLLAQDDIDGGLIGGAALKAEDFLAIINAAEQI